MGDILVGLGLGLALVALFGLAGYGALWLIEHRENHDEHRDNFQ